MSQNISDDSKRLKRRGPGLAITSLIIGILMLLSTLVTFYKELEHAWTMAGGTAIPVVFYYVITLVVLVGLISGILGLNSNKKGMAITGIILCSLLFLLHIYSFVSYIQY